MEGANYRIDAKEIIIDLVKNPIIYLRLLGILFSIIVFGCLADKAYQDVDGNGDDDCLINDSNACNFGVAVGVIGMVMCIGFYFKDIVYVIIKDNKIRGILLLVDAVAFAFWGFFWFVSFCFMADQWRRVDSNDRDGIESTYGHSTIDNIQAAIAFSFFGILVWVAIVVVNIVFLVRGPGFPWNPKAVGTMGRDPSSHTGGYAAFPGDETPDDSYQPPEY